MPRTAAKQKSLSSSKVSSDKPILVTVGELSVEVCTMSVTFTSSIVLPSSNFFEDLCREFQGQIVEIFANKPDGTKRSRNDRMSLLSSLCQAMEKRIRKILKLPEGTVLPIDLDLREIQPDN